MLPKPAIAQAHSIAVARVEDTTGAQRLDCIDAAKGLAIVLVVWGHVVARAMPANAAWYEVSKQLVYSFHMPFFMFLSGLVFFKSLKPMAGWEAVRGGIAKRFFRLIPAYLLFAGIVIAGKYAAQQVVHVDNPVTSWSALRDVVLYPIDSPAGFLWYVHTLFLISALALVILQLGGRSLIPLVVLATSLQFFELPGFLGLQRVGYFLLFFVAGGAVVANWGSYTRFVDRFWLPCIAIFACTLGFVAAGLPVLRLAALLSIPALHGLVRQTSGGVRHALVWLGGYSFAIYLMNTMAIGATKAALAPFFAWQGLQFALVYAPALFAAGLFLPIIAKKWFIPRIPWLDRITT